MLPLTMPQDDRRATYQDVLDAPESVIAEIVDGVLHTQPRPAPAHARAASMIATELGGAFDGGKGGPGGWILLFEPELHLHGNVLVPDYAGWRRERLPRKPEGAGIEVPPDWARAGRLPT